MESPAQPPESAVLTPRRRGRSPLDQAVRDLPRVLGWVQGQRPGPRLVCVAGLHGNEPAGVLAVQNVFQAIQRDTRGLRGEFIGLTGHRKALDLGRRYIFEDLNRIWTLERVQEVRGRERSSEPEDGELLELLDELDPILQEGPDRTFVFDIHSTSGPGPPFALLDDSLENRRFALEFPVPLVLGLEEKLGGTLLVHLTRRGATTIAFEAGQHQAEASVERAEAGIWIALEAAGLLRKGRRVEAIEARRFLSSESRGLPRVVEIRYRHRVIPEDRFRMREGFRSFQEVNGGELLAEGSEGEIRAPEAGLLLMPLYQPQGEDGFFIVRKVNLSWLRVSSFLRRLRLERVVQRLPGIERHPELEEAFIIDRRKARWLGLELFHLLGYRLREERGRHIVVDRRSMR